MPSADARPSKHLASPPLIRLALVTAIGALVANCGAPQRSAGAVRSASDVDPRYGVRASPRVIAEGEPVPKGGGREIIGKPYVVAGRTYVPREDRGYAREGLASWYGSAFHGRLTANGEVFDREALAAAHPTLPLPSYARVTNLRNGRSLIVRVNDRGPYHEDRLIDVSERAANALGFQRVGTSRVRVEYVGRASTRGSDDAKLMATLRTDGRSAPFRGPTTPTLIASAGASAGAALSSPSAPLRLAGSLPSDDGAPSEPGERTEPAEAPAEANPPLPPARPVLLASAPSTARVTGGATAARPAPPTALSYAAVGPERSTGRR